MTSESTSKIENLSVGDIRQFPVESCLFGSDLCLALSEGFKLCTDLSRAIAHFPCRCGWQPGFRGWVWTFPPLPLSHSSGGLGSAKP